MNLSSGKIVIVEDESSLSEMIKMNLELEGFTTVNIADGQQAIKEIDQLANADLVILDVMLPHVNGIEICRQLRTISNTPVLFLSAKGTTADKITGLKAGGTDYLAKPFDLEELLLRVNILIDRNTPVKELDELQIGSKTVDFKTYQVRENGVVSIELSKKEIELLKLFMEKEGQVVSRDEILDRVWGADQYPTSRTIDNFILAFRKTFEANPKEPKYFHSVRGVGYRFTNS